MRNDSINRSSIRMQDFQMHYFSSAAAKIANMTRDGYDVIRLDEGAPDMPPPKEVVETLYQSASRASNHSYQSHRGTRELREAWTKMYHRLYGLDLNPESQVVPLIGSKEGIVHFPMTVVNPGDVVLVPDPGYITYTRGAILAGGEPYFLPLLPENQYLPALEQIPPEILERARLLWLNYPNNPTAAFASAEFFRSIIGFARKHQIIVCHDAAYNQVTFTGRPAPSILQFDGALDVAVEFNTLSKSHNMAGWRVGAILGNAELIKLFSTFKTNLDSGHFLPVMDAAVAAMTGDQEWISERNEIYRQRKDEVVSALRAMNFDVDDPHGSLYIWCPILPGWNSIDFTRLILEDAQVSLTPGTVFGKQGEGFMRISITAPQHRITEAMNRLERIIRKVRERIG